MSNYNEHFCEHFLKAYLLGHRRCCGTHNLYGRRARDDPAGSVSPTRHGRDGLAVCSGAVLAERLDVAGSVRDFHLHRDAVSSLHVGERALVDDVVLRHFFFLGVGFFFGVRRGSGEVYPDFFFKKMNRVCVHCSTPVTYNVLGFFVCEKCGVIASQLENVESTLSYNEKVNECKNTDYKRLKYFTRNHLSLLLGRRKLPMDHETLVEIARGILFSLDDKKLSPAAVHAWLLAQKRLKESRYYIQIYCSVAGVSFPVLSQAEEDFILRLFPLVQDAFSKMQCRRANFVPYGYFMHQMCSMLKRQDLHYFLLFRTKNMLEINEIWEGICRALKLPFLAI